MSRFTQEHVQEFICYTKRAIEPFDFASNKFLGYESRVGQNLSSGSSLDGFLGKDVWLIASKDGSTA